MQFLFFVVFWWGGVFRRPSSTYRRHSSRVGQACGALVAPGGALVMSTLNRTPKAWLLAIAAAEHLARLLPVGTHDWRRFRTPAEMAAAMEGRAGLRVRDLSGIVFRPEALKPMASPSAWGLSSSDVDVNYILHATRARSS